MRLFFFMLSLVLLSPALIGQITYSFVKHDFGDLHPEDDRFVDLTLTNNTDKKCYILRIEQVREVTNLIEKDLILPGQTVKIRFQVNPKTKGKFNYKIPVYTSDKNEATVIQLLGSLKEPIESLTSMQDCPDFSKRPNAQNDMDFTFTVETRDAVTKEKLGQVDVVILQNGRPVGKGTTVKNGQFKTKIPLGITYFYAQTHGYAPAEEGMYVNFKRNKIVLNLMPLAETDTPTEEVGEVVLNEDATTQKDSLTPLIELEKIKEIVFSRKEVEEITEEIDITEVKREKTFESLAKTDFNEEDFMPVNVVFVIDVSSSMRQEDRLELMKYSLYQLVDMLRPMDQMGLVAYATRANVLLPVTSGANKDEINEIVEGMKASGLTAGAEGIKLGFKQVRKNFIPDAHNHVIVITDGAFNTGSVNYEKLFRRYLKRGITLSVVGIKSNEKAEKSMQEVATEGKGELILIQGLEDAQNNLRQAIRKAAFKG